MVSELAAETSNLHAVGQYSGNKLHITVVSNNWRQTSFIVHGPHD